MKKYTAPELELFSFMKEEILFGSDENETPNDRYDNQFEIDEV